MDKFAFWTLKILSYVFLISAGVTLILWVSSDAPDGAWLFYSSAILTSLFFAAASHVFCRVIEKIYAGDQEEESVYSLPDYSND